MSLFVQYIHSKSQQDFFKKTSGVSQIDRVFLLVLYFRQLDIASVLYVGQILFVHLFCLVCLLNHQRNFSPEITELFCYWVVLSEVELFGLH